MRAIAVKSWCNNTKFGVTGYLHYDGAAFRQEMVGDPRAVALLAAAILADARHNQIEVLRYNPVAERRFDRWRLFGFDAAMSTGCGGRPMASDASNVIRGLFDTE